MNALLLSVQQVALAVSLPSAGKISSRGGQAGQALIQQGAPQSLLDMLQPPASDTSQVYTLARVNDLHVYLQQMSYECIATVSYHKLFDV